MVPKIATMADF